MSQTLLLLPATFVSVIMPRMIRLSLVSSLLQTLFVAGMQQRTVAP